MMSPAVCCKSFGAAAAAVGFSGNDVARCLPFLLPLRVCCSTLCVEEETLIEIERCFLSIFFETVFISLCRPGFSCIPGTYFFERFDRVFRLLVLWFPYVRDLLSLMSLKA